VARSASLCARRTGRRPLYCLPALAASWTVEGRVVAVSGGDTITMLDDAET
jgi:hypothetical protein